jgi:hypothetical protein
MFDVADDIIELCARAVEDNNAQRKAKGSYSCR